MREDEEGGGSPRVKVTRGPLVITMSCIAGRRCRTVYSLVRAATGNEAEDGEGEARPGDSVSPMAIPRPIERIAAPVQRRTPIDQLWTAIFETPESLENDATVFLSKLPQLSDRNGRLLGEFKGQPHFRLDDGMRN